MTIAEQIAALTWTWTDADRLREMAKVDGMNVYRYRDGSCRVERVVTRTGEARTDDFPTVEAAFAALGITTQVCDGLRAPWGYIPGLGWATS